MPVSSYPLDDLLPHRPPMVLIDEVVSFDAEAKSLTAAVVAKPAWHESWVAIEWMAQTAAALAGESDRRAGYTGAPRPGFLLGTRKLELDVPQFDIGTRYLITATCVFEDAESASFMCEISDGTRSLARATLNAYRPTNAEQFIKENTK